MLDQVQVKKIQKHLQRADDRLVKVFAALSDPGRYRIFMSLIDHEGICVTEVANILGVSVPAASQQLKIMENGGLIVRQRDGQKICYETNTQDPCVRAIIKLIQQ